MDTTGGERDVGSGALTFLFTDIEGSTLRWQADRAGMEDALAAHDATLSSAVDGSGGHVFKHTGDGICAVFASPARAVAAALEAQAALELPVRMGIHTGEAQERDGDWFGPTLNRCARIADAGHGGQVLVSDTTRSLLDGVETLDLGEHVLKDLAAPQRIFQVGTARFPPLRHTRGRVTLPAVLTGLHGRADLLAEVIARLGEERVVTLVGVGGVGKTRLALAAAQGAAPSRDLTAFVDLGAVAAEHEVLPALARALGLTSVTHDAVTMALSGRRALLVVDNCEHVVDAASRVVLDVLAAGDGVGVLATSREPLGLGGEHVIAVPGLDGSEPDSPAVALFVERAGAASSLFADTGTSRVLAAEICRRLDGIPLAIELAAARVGVMTLPDLLDRLGERFDVLTGGRRLRSRDRHRTLRQTIDWSYDLLDGAERDLFVRLGVFAASFDLAGAVAVAGGRSEVEVLDLVAALVDKSLLTVTRPEGLHRYRFLETIRAYAHERLGTGGPASDVRRGLQSHLAASVRAGVDRWHTDPIGVARGIRVDIPNMRSAFDTALAARDVDAAAGLIAPVAELIGFIGWQIDGWADEVLALPGAAGNAAEPAMRALRMNDFLIRTDFRSVRTACAELLAAAGAVGDDASELAPWWVHMDAAYALHLVAEDTASLRENDRAIRSVAGSDPDVALLCRLRRLMLPEVSAAVAAETGDEPPELASGDVHVSPFVRMLARLARVVIARERADHDGMLRHARAAAELGVEGSAFWLACFDYQACAQLEMGDLGGALANADFVLESAREHGDRSATIPAIMTLALVLQRLDEPEAAAVLRGWLPGRVTVFYADRMDELDGWLAASLGGERLAARLAEGRSLEPAELRSLARTAIDPHLAG